MVSHGVSWCPVVSPGGPRSTLPALTTSSWKEHQHGKSQSQQISKEPARQGGGVCLPAHARRQHRRQHPVEKEAPEHTGTGYVPA
jgi:hypothetical protein